MGKPKPREYIVHEMLTVTNVYSVLATNKAEAIEMAKLADETVFMTDARPTGEWWVESRRGQMGWNT